MRGEGKAVEMKPEDVSGGGPAHAPGASVAGTAESRERQDRERRHRILRERARALAEKPEAETQGTSLELLTFRLADETYALESRHVQEVHLLRSLTPVPCTPAFVLGIVNVRGRIVSVVDLGRLLDLPTRGLTNAARVILLGGEQMEFGVLADSVSGVVTILEASVRPPPSSLGVQRVDLLEGVAEGGLIVLDAERILSSADVIVYEEVEAAQGRLAPQA